MSIGIITLLMFASLLIVLITGLPLSFVLGGLAAVFAYFLWSSPALGIIGSNVLSIMSSYILIAVPMFILMANILERSGVADDLYEMMYRWFGQLRGGLAVGTVIICTLFAAMSGVSAAGTVTMGIVALPSMLKRNYDKHLAMGSIMAGGALGILIPPSVMMVIYGLFSGESVGMLFMGGIFPGLLLSTLFCGYIIVRSALQPQLAPSIPPGESANWREKFISLKAVILPIFLVLGVLGSIFFGIATPTEASAIGAFGAVLCAAIYRKLNWQMFKESLYRTLRLSGMVIWVVFGATCFASVYIALGAVELSKEIIEALPVSRWIILIGIQFSFLVLGCFLDAAGIIMICTPIYIPVITALGFNPLWFGILFVVNMEMAFLTPPFGYNLFYMKGVAPPGITVGDIYRSIIPFLILQAIGLIIVMLFPEIALWLPSKMFTG